MNADVFEIPTHVSVEEVQRSEFYAAGPRP